MICKRIWTGVFCISMISCLICESFVCEYIDSVYLQYTSQHLHAIMYAQTYKIIAYILLAEAACLWRASIPMAHH